MSGSLPGACGGIGLYSGAAVGVDVAACFPLCSTGVCVCVTTRGCVRVFKHLFVLTVYRHPAVRVTSAFLCVLNMHTGVVRVCECVCVYVCVCLLAYGRGCGIEEALSVMFREVALTGDRALSRKHGHRWKDFWHPPTALAQTAGE